MSDNYRFGAFVALSDWRMYRRHVVFFQQYRADKAGLVAWFDRRAAAFRYSMWRGWSFAYGHSVWWLRFRWWLSKYV